jgi:hypothetical protein
LELTPDYFQFYLFDSDARPAPENWTDQNLSDRMHVAPGVVVVSPIRNTPVPVEISIWDSEPQVVFNQWQHVVEAPLVLEDPSLEVHECCGESMARFTVSPGDYVIRALMRNLDKLSDDGLKGEDFYEVQIWPGKLLGLRVLRRWSN